jgi:hypothetical protein
MRAAVSGVNLLAYRHISADGELGTVLGAAQQVGSEMNHLRNEHLWFGTSMVPVGTTGREVGLDLLPHGAARPAT